MKLVDLCLAMYVQITQKIFAKLNIAVTVTHKRQNSSKNVNIDTHDTKAYNLANIGVD